MKIFAILILLSQILVPQTGIKPEVVSASEAFSALPLVVRMYCPSRMTWLCKI